MVAGHPSKVRYPASGDYSDWYRLKELHRAVGVEVRSQLCTRITEELAVDIARGNDRLHEMSEVLTVLDERLAVVGSVHVSEPPRPTRSEDRMGKLIYVTNTSLDGFTEDATGSFDWSVPNEEVHEFYNDMMRGVGTQLLGRRMYETMA